MRRSCVVVGLLAFSPPSFAQPAPDPDPPPPTGPTLPPDPAPPTGPTLPPDPAPAPIAAPDPTVAPEPPAEPAEIVAHESLYPLSVAARPLLLPRGAVEGTVGASVQHIDLGEPQSLDTLYGSLSGRYGFGAGEVEAGVDVVLGESAPESLMLAEPERLADVYGVVRFAAATDAKVGAIFQLYRPAADSRVYATRLVFGNKFHFKSSAVVFELIPGIEHSTPALTDGITYGTIAAGVQAQAQVSERVALQARTSLAYVNRIGVDPRGTLGLPDAYFSQTYGLRLWLAAGDGFDFIADADVLRAGVDGKDAMQYALSIVIRSRQ